MSIKLRNAIEDIIVEAEEQENHKLSGDEIIFLIDTYHELVTGAITKFIRGAKEHSGEGDFLTECDHSGEAIFELQDFIHYLYAARQAQRQHDKRIG